MVDDSDIYFLELYMKYIYTLLVLLIIKYNALLRIIVIKKCVQEKRYMINTCRPPRCISILYS